MRIDPKYIIDEQNQRTAVLLDIDTFQKIEEILENYALYHLMEDEVADDEDLDSEEALEYYKSLTEKSSPAEKQ